MNYCTYCRRDFGSVRAFDAHRVGAHAYTFREGLDMEPSREDGRRCLDPDEFLEHGLVSNRYGRWSLGRDITRGDALRAVSGNHGDAGSLF